jgi:hypothetical protein
LIHRDFYHRWVAVLVRAVDKLGAKWPACGAEALAPRRPAVDCTKLRLVPRDPDYVVSEIE